MRRVLVMGLGALTLVLAAGCSKKPRANGPGEITHSTPDAALAKPVPVVDAALSRLSAEPESHRAVAGNCGVNGGKGNPDKTVSGCQSDADCKNPQLGAGRCVNFPGGHDMPRNECHWDGCKADADCGAGQVCACGGGGWRSSVDNVCLIGNCRVDADCGAGGFCSGSKSSNDGPTGGGGSCGGATAGFFCHDPKKDACMQRSDCKNSGDECVFSPAQGHWVCQDIYSNCPVG
jgi:hypothetical protein